jgi:hypothetical protein
MIPVDSGNIFENLFDILVSKRIFILVPEYLF